MASYPTWRRAAYVFFMMSVLAALLKLGGASLADPKPLSYDVPVPAEAPPASAGIDSSKNSEELTAEFLSLKSERPKGRASFPRNEDSSRSSGLQREPQVFERPSLGTTSTGPVCGDLGDFPKSSKAVFPMAGDYFYSYDDTWGAPRPQGGHEGTDLMSPAGTPEYAITDGMVVPVSGASASGWNTLGGYTVMVRADYAVGPIKAGDIFYYAHMDRQSPLKPGDRVRAGQVVGYAGDTGQGPEVTRGLFPPHLHLGWYDTGGARTSLASGAMNPYPLLEWLKNNGGTVAGGSGVEYCEAPAPPSPIPSTGGSYWQFPDTPGSRPDLDTGSDDPRPSPVADKSERSVEHGEDIKKEVIKKRVIRRKDNSGPMNEISPVDPPDARETPPSAKRSTKPIRKHTTKNIKLPLPALRGLSPAYDGPISDALRKVARDRDLAAGSPSLRKWLSGFLRNARQGSGEDRNEKPERSESGEPRACPPALKGISLKGYEVCEGKPTPDIETELERIPPHGGSTIFEGSAAGNIEDENYGATAPEPAGAESAEDAKPTTSP